MPKLHARVFSCLTAPAVHAHGRGSFLSSQTSPGLVHGAVFKAASPAQRQHRAAVLSVGNRFWFMIFEIPVCFLGAGDCCCEELLSLVTGNAGAVLHG